MTGSSADSPRSILLITLSNIGDALMTTPVMEALHQKYPGAVMDIVTDARARPIFTHCPYRGDIFLKEKQLGWRGTLSLVRQLRKKRYDLIVDLRTDGLTLLLHGTCKLTRRGRVPAGPHAVESHFGVISQSESFENIPALQAWPGDAARSFATQSLSGLPGKRWLAVAPGARWAPKRWPAEFFSQTVDAIRDQLDAVLLLGDNNDRDACQHITDSLTLPVVNLCGKTSLLEAAAILEQAQLFIGNDSGTGHLAAAMNTPTVTVFGPGDPERYNPWHSRACWVQSDTGSINDVSVADVAKQLTALLA